MFRSANSYRIRFKIAGFFFALAIWHNYFLFWTTELYDSIPWSSTNCHDVETFCFCCNLLYLCFVSLLIINGLPYFAQVVNDVILSCYVIVMLIMIDLSFLCSLIMKHACGNVHSYFFAESSKFLTISTCFILWNIYSNLGAAEVADLLFNVPESDCSGSTLIRIEKDNSIIISFPNLNTCLLTNQQVVDVVLDVDDITGWLMFSIEQTMEDIPSWMLSAISRTAAPPG